ncbi:hypothetical protein GJ744_005477 [Endocarpon pusillum]|uniref:Uncharacterized protein n=1 Tax=Endocarpon pusillum TaxID=364733 RepID=A0A8H7E142_9EURO|nr:hypothetical protein GJ744_005477 [Endocarpon pusillum]
MILYLTYKEFELDSSSKSSVYKAIPVSYHFLARSPLRSPTVQTLGLLPPGTLIPKPLEASRRDFKYS